VKTCKSLCVARLRIKLLTGSIGDMRGSVCDKIKFFDAVYESISKLASFVRADKYWLPYPHKYEIANIVRLAAEVRSTKRFLCQHPLLADFRGRIENSTSQISWRYLGD
jgi:hypothetical protein